MEEPPEEATYAEVYELNPFIGELGWMNAKVTENESWYHNGCKETYVEGVHCMMDVGSVLLDQRVCETPADNGQDAIYVG